MTADRGTHESPAAAVWLWIRRRIERVPSQESLGVARYALEKIRRQPTGRDLADELRTTGAELVILLSTASYEAAADAADARRALLPRLSAERQVTLAGRIRHLLDLAVDAYIRACRLHDAGIAIDARGSAARDAEARELRSTRAFLHAIRGDTTAARSLLDESSDLPHDVAVAEPRSDREMSARDLTALLTITDLWPRTRAQALLLLAVHERRAGQMDAARRAPRRAVAIAFALKACFLQSLVPRSDPREIARDADAGLPRDLSTSEHLDAALTSIRLTKREAIHLARLESGSTLPEIAAAEFVTLSTVKSQAASLYRKLGVSSRHEAVERARRRGMLR